VEDHVRALASTVAGADNTVIVLTHGHADHAAAAPQLAAETGAEVWGPEGLSGVDRVLTDGDTIDTDWGSLITVHTPGHTAEHICLHWAERRAIFVGDLLLGQGDTTWVAEYPGCVSDYLASIARLKNLELSVIYPAHGPALERAGEALGRFETHRLARVQQVREAMTTHPHADLDELIGVVYGAALPQGMRGAAGMSLSALVDYVRETED
jgi:glyoxylase-like metal-dependent hydrolase (beta-lactamase superfamily II)